jgi:Rha family phage regulatory protein
MSQSILVPSASVPAISGHIAVVDGQPTTTTQDIADVYGKQHAKVLAIVRQRMAEVDASWRLANFGETVIERPNPSGGAPIQSPVIRLTKKGFHFVVGKFTGAKAVQHQIAFADEFERMEQALRQPALPAPAFDWHAQIMAANSALEVPLPKKVKTALNRKAWALTHEAYELLQEHQAPKKPNNRPESRAHSRFRVPAAGTTLKAARFQDRAAFSFSPMKAPLDSPQPSA